MRKFAVKIDSESGSFIEGTGNKRVINSLVNSLINSGVAKKDIEIIPVKNKHTGFYLVSGILCGIGICSLAKYLKKKVESISRS